MSQQVSLVEVIGQFGLVILSTYCILASLHSNSHSQNCINCEMIKSGDAMVLGNPKIIVNFNISPDV